MIKVSTKYGRSKGKHPTPSGPGGKGVRKGFLGLVHVEKVLEFVSFESIAGEKDPKQERESTGKSFCI